MSHFYCLDHAPYLIKEAKTPAQARKIKKQEGLKKVYPSVTTVLSICKDEFIDTIYKPSKLVELARMEENWRKSWKDIEQLTYGTRECPETGTQIPSSEFGTNVHKRMEDMIWDKYYGKPNYKPTAYDEHCELFLDYMEEHEVKPIATEYMVSCNRMKICGSIDLVAEKDGEKVLYDYKCRTGVTKKGKPIVYPKDLWQLAIEAKILGALSIVSVIIDCDTKEHFHYKWTEEQMKHGTEIAKLCAKLYWMLRM